MDDTLYVSIRSVPRMEVSQILDGSFFLWLFIGVFLMFVIMIPLCLLSFWLKSVSYSVLFLTYLFLYLKLDPSPAPHLCLSSTVSLSLSVSSDHLSSYTGKFL